MNFKRAALSAAIVTATTFGAAGTVSAAPGGVGSPGPSTIGGSLDYICSGSECMCLGTADCEDMFENLDCISDWIDETGLPFGYCKFSRMNRPGVAGQPGRPEVVLPGHLANSQSVGATANTDQAGKPASHDQARIPKRPSKQIQRSKLSRKVAAAAKAVAPGKVGAKKVAAKRGTAVL